MFIAKFISCKMIGRRTRLAEWGKVGKTMMTSTLDRQDLMDCLNPNDIADQGLRQFLLGWFEPKPEPTRHAEPHLPGYLTVAWYQYRFEAINLTEII